MFKNLNLIYNSTLNYLLIYSPELHLYAQTISTKMKLSTFHSQRNGEESQE